MTTRVTSRSRQPAASPRIPPPVLPDVLQFMRVLWAIVHGLQKASKRMASELGVTGPQRLVLRVLGLYPGASAGTLARILHVHPSTLTGVLQRLVERRLLRRVAAADDRRRTVLYLTPAGQRVNRRGTRTVEAAIAAALKEVGRVDTVATARALSIVAAHLQERPTSAARGRAPGRGGSAAD